MTVLEGVVQEHRLSAPLLVELEEPLPDLPADGVWRLVVARLCGEALGTVLAEPGTPAAALALQLAEALPGALDAAARRHGLPAAPLSAAGLPHGPCPVRDRLAQVRSAAEPLSVVLCTRDRPESARRCITSLLALDHPEVEVVVVDNAPPDDRTAQVCRELANPRLRYVLDPVPGLSHARNTGVRAATHALLGFVDDDEVIDPGWATAVVDQLTASPRRGAVSGVVLPWELETEAQVRYEQFGGHSKGRGFVWAEFGTGAPDEQSPLYPLPAFGVGANMAFRREALAQAGGFDEALGAGTRAKACEDTSAFSEVLLAGWSTVYAPSALTWHVHRRDDAALLSQLTGYGVGLGAYYTALLLRDPRRLPALVRLAPQALRDLRRPDSARNATMSQLPPEVGRANLTGLLRGPGAYLSARRQARRSRRA